MESKQKAVCARCGRRRLEGAGPPEALAPAEVGRYAETALGARPPDALVLSNPLACPPLSRPSRKAATRPPTGRALTNAAEKSRTPTQGGRVLRYRKRKLSKPMPRLTPPKTIKTSVGAYAAESYRNQCRARVAKRESHRNQPTPGVVPAPAPASNDTPLEALGVSPARRAGGPQAHHGTVAPFSNLHLVSMTSRAQKLARSRLLILRCRAWRRRRARPPAKPPSG